MHVFATCRQDMYFSPYTTHDHLVKKGLLRWCRETTNSFSTTSKTSSAVSTYKYKKCLNKFTFSTKEISSLLLVMIFNACTTILGRHLQVTTSSFEWTSISVASCLVRAHCNASPLDHLPEQFITCSSECQDENLYSNHLRFFTTTSLHYICLATPEKEVVLIRL